ncbi:MULTISPECIES: hypothetical protein [unclassified Streptomyces]|uniref:hypothetical protein n=1 Tax=unclassified Streptomyces TaxID=2593676 RepID=UPI003FD48C46
MNDDLATPGADQSLSPGPGDPGAESRGCLFALSQPPLMLFLTVIGALLLFTALYDLYPW